MLIPVNEISSAGYDGISTSPRTSFIGRQPSDCLTRMQFSDTRVSSDEYNTILHIIVHIYRLVYKANIDYTSFPVPVGLQQVRKKL